MELSRAEVIRYQNTILGTSGHRSSTPMIAFDFLLVFYSDLRCRWNRCRVISVKFSRNTIPSKRRQSWQSWITTQNHYFQCLSFSKTWLESRLLCLLRSIAFIGPLYEKVTSFIKREVHNVSQRRQRRTESQPRATRTKN